jgi:limonene-1,2-epoxide hydrolase
MRALLMAVAALVIAVPAGSTLSPAAVVRAWSKALNRNDNEAAANLFAPNAVVTQPGYRVVLKTHKSAVVWNNLLPCSGHITSLLVNGTSVTANFTLGERPKHKCDAPGRAAAAVFRIHNGKIVLWRQVPPVSQPVA